MEDSSGNHYHRFRRCDFCGDQHDLNNLEEKQFYESLFFENSWFCSNACYQLEAAERLGEALFNGS